ITDIGQVWNLGAAANLGVFRFDEAAELAIFAKLRVWTDESERTDVSVRADDGFLSVGANDACAAPDLHVGQCGIGADDGVIIDMRRAPQLGSWVDDDIAANRDIYSNPRSEEHTSELQSRFDLVCRL